MSIDQNAKYSKEHEWVSIDGNVAVLGITDYAQEQIGEVVFFEFPRIDTEVWRGDTLVSIETVKTVLDLHALVSGIIVEVNEYLIDSPEQVNESPYEDGWLAKIEMSNSAELNDLMDEAAYIAYLEELS